MKVEFVHKAYIEKSQAYDTDVYQSNNYVSDDDDGPCEVDELYEGACKPEINEDLETIRAVFPDLRDDFIQKMLQRYNVSDAIIMLTEGNFVSAK
jgi:CUE domain